MTASSAPVRTYYVQGRWRFWSGFFLFGVMGVFMTWRFLVSALAGAWGGGLAVGLLALVFIVPAVYSLLYSRTRVVMAPEGVHFYGLGYHLSTPWENIARLVVIPFSLYYRDPELIGGLPPQLTELTGSDLNPEGVEGLYLIAPVVNQSWLGRGRPTRLIPLIEYKKWRETDLFIEFRRFAPHLFGLAPRPVENPAA